MSSNDSDTDCQESYYFQIGSEAMYTVSYIVSPFFLTFGFFGHILCFMACCNQTKTEKAYMYQIMVTISEIALVLANAFYQVTFNWWGGQYWPGPSWYVSNYAFMWISARLSISITNSMNTMTQYMSVFMAIDRFRALYDPVNFKTSSNRTYAFTVIFSIFIGFATNMFQSFEMEISGPVNGTYVISFGSDFAISTLNFVFIQIRNSAIVAGLLALYFCNIGIPILYYNRLKTAANVISSNSEKERRKNAKMLTILSTSQSILVTLGNTSLIAFYFYVGLHPPCWCSRIPLLAALLDCALHSTSMLNFYMVFIFSRQFRGMIFKALRNWKSFWRKNAVSSTVIVVQMKNLK